jgi:ATP-binding cassette, subfamily F, member 3
VATLHVSGLAKAYGGHELFKDVSFRLTPGQRLALVGRNGSGKTSLLRILAGEISADGGEIARSRTVRLALHDQRPPRSSGRTLEAYVAESLADVHAAEARLAELEARMAGGAHDEDTLRDYASAQAALEAAGGYEWRTRIESILRGLGFAHADLGRPLDTFSGGELTRASLARALAARPDVLLLDEPTNHLDLVSLEWLEREIQSLDASVLLVSHDRWFLESVANGVLELELGRSKVYAMGYSAYRREKAQQLETQAGAWERQQEEIQRLERFVAKFKAGTRARQAKSVEKRLGRMERVEKPRGEKSLAFGFPKTTRPGRIVLEADDLRLVAGEKLLVQDASFALERGARVAVIGPNGSGKTTLIETLLGRRRPAGGRIKLGHNAEVAYFSQHVEELPENATVLEAMCLGTALNQGQARNLLGRFLFGGDTVERRVGVLSGGERRRLSLARLVASGANTLVLDEPTNHLDIESREALEEALDAFDGTILFVSHDRALIDAVADETLSVERHRLVQRPGDYNDYLAATAAQAPAAEPAKPKPKPPPRQAETRPAPQPRSSARRPPQRLVRRIRELEERIATLEEEVAGLEHDLADPAVATDRDLVSHAAAQHRAKQEELSWLMREWEEASVTAEEAG